MKLIMGKQVSGQDNKGASRPVCSYCAALGRIPALGNGQRQASMGGGGGRRARSSILVDKDEVVAAGEVDSDHHTLPSTQGTGSPIARWSTAQVATASTRDT